MPYKGDDVLIPKVSLHEFLLKRNLHKGDAIALVENTDSARSLTFQQIYDHSRNCAAFLHQLGVKKGDFVALCAPNCVEFTTAMFGIMTCGAVVVTCNPCYTEGEVLQQFEITEPSYAIIHEDAIETMKKVQSKLSCMKEIFVIGKSKEFRTFDTIIQAHPDLDQGFLDKIEFSPADDLAMVPYSSGTTGMPKSVMLTHRNLVSSMFVYVKHSGWPVDEDHLCGYMDRQMYHAGGFGSVLLSLTVGMKLVMAQEVDFETTLKAVEKYKVTHLMTLPPIMIQLVNSDDTENYATESLMYITGGGSVMAPDILCRMADKFNVTVAPAYGLTEAGSVSMSRDVRKTRSSVGKITPTVELKIIDLVSGNECGADQDGEIVIRGPQVTKGYYKNSKATSETIDQDGWFHTGDIGHVDKEGLLYVIDRLKEVIKYKGVQVSPAELESVILKLPKVADVGVIGIPDPVDCELPKAFVVRKDESLSEEDVATFVKDHLVDYKQLRGGVEFVNAIPKSITGKIVRKELKKMAML